MTPIVRSWHSLKQVLSSHSSLLIAFSGGVDSSLLLAASAQTLGHDQVKAAICIGPFTPPWELAQAISLADKLGVELIQSNAHELDNERIVANGTLRCYYCKHLKMSLLQEMARQMNLQAVAEGSHMDDHDDERPGARAVAELGIISPLKQAGLDKAQIRALSQYLKLPSANAAASACLATRIATGRPLSKAALERIAQGESRLRPLFKGHLRLRDQFPLARLELDAHELADAHMQKGVIERLLRPLGYEQISYYLYGG